MLSIHCDFETSPKKKVCILEAEEDHIMEEICRLYPSIDGTEHPNWVKVQSSKYHTGVFILLRYDMMSPKYGKIADIVVINETVILSLQVFESRHFDNLFFICHHTHFCF